MVHPVHIPPAPVAVPAIDVDPEDTLPHVPDVADEEEDEAPTERTEVSASGPTSSAVNPPAKGIDSYSIKDIQYRMQFFPSDLHHHEYFGGGS